ncbi:Arc family DNA-binding protein [Mesorhizobium sp. M0222]|uniref:Arc family DNA-binding protein n=1 Tax=unclassified Mesorhizobium TaxID=325217 RepID=UPI0003CE1193|nr:Arc family DNA-binding protein [Mesorhizobium sp. LNJC391B00]ESY21438.1 transcriptional regulator [Mesorhizobium sp. LNJC391B00]
MPDPITFHARLPASLLKRLKIAAAEDGRSMNAEIVARLVKSFELTEAEREQVKALLAQAQAVIDGSS